MKFSCSTLLIVTAIVLAFAVSAFSQRPTPTTGTVTKKDALAVIARMKATLKSTKKTIDAKYDYFVVTATLGKIFREKGVTGRAMQYASAWGQNSVYATLSDIGPFYIYHLEQLEASERRLVATANGSVRQTDMQRLTEGMSDWEATAAKALRGMDKMAGHFGSRAALLEKKFEADRVYRAAPAAQKPIWERQAKAFDQLANQENRRAFDAKTLIILPIGKTRHFTSISPIDATPCTNTTVTPLVLTPIPPFEGGQQ